MFTFAIIVTVLSCVAAFAFFGKNIGFDGWEELEIIVEEEEVVGDWDWIFELTSISDEEMEEMEVEMMIQFGATELPSESFDLSDLPLLDLTPMDKETIYPTYINNKKHTKLNKETTNLPIKQEKLQFFAPNSYLSLLNEKQMENMKAQEEALAFLFSEDFKNLEDQLDEFYASVA